MSLAIFQNERVVFFAGHKLPFSEKAVSLYP
jgi:hypothetical protein